MPSDDEDALPSDADDRPGVAELRHLCFEALERELAPDEARRLIEAFCACVEGRTEMPPELLDRLSRAFREYLSGAKGLDSALGLSRRRGRPPVNEDLRSEMAAEILRHRLARITHQLALEEVSRRYGWVESVVGEAWARYRHDAVNILRIERALAGGEWTVADRFRLCEIYGFDPLC